MISPSVGIIEQKGMLIAAVATTTEVKMLVKIIKKRRRIKWKKRLLVKEKTNQMQTSAFRGILEHFENSRVRAARVRELSIVRI